MAAGQRTPSKGIIAAAASGLLATLCFAGTAIAAHNSTTDQIIGEIIVDSNDELAADELVAPTASAAMHAALDRNSPPADDVKLPANQTVVKQPKQAERKVPDVTARIPGISNNGFARFKRQMYRRDI